MTNTHQQTKKPKWNWQIPKNTQTTKIESWRENLNRTITSMETESLIEKLPTNRS